jgi:hypothetical protein
MVELKIARNPVMQRRRKGVIKADTGREKVEVYARIDEEMRPSAFM